MRRGRLRLLVLALVVVASAAAVWWMRDGRPPMDQPVADATAPAATAAPGPTADAEPAPGDPLAGDPLATLAEAPRGPWTAVDMDALRRTIPDNLYWAMAAPTKDEALERWRREERDRWNVEYGKVLSGTGTEAEVDAYFAHRRRLSNDYLEFAGYVLAHYGDKLPAQDKQLLNLAMDMHMVRLEELPRQLAEAQERRVKHEAARQAWLAEQQAFDAAPVPPAD